MFIKHFKRFQRKVGGLLTFPYPPHLIPTIPFYGHEILKEIQGN